VTAALHAKPRLDCSCRLGRIKGTRLRRSSALDPPDPAVTCASLLTLSKFRPAQIGGDCHVRSLSILPPEPKNHLAKCGEAR
jgi:hypothetical protein